MIEDWVADFIKAYNEIGTALPEKITFLPTLFLLAVIIALYGIFIWFFYRSLAKRDVLKLNLAQYNTYQHPAVIKTKAILFYILEFMIISPLVIFFWFTVLSIFLIVLAKEVDVGSVILICSALISAVRITSYFKEDLSRELAKLIPLTLLGIAILTPGFLDITTSVNRILEIPLFFNSAIYYLLFIVALEVVLRIAYLPFVVIESEKD